MIRIVEAMMRVFSRVFVVLFPILYVLIRWYGEGDSLWWFAVISTGIGVAHCMFARTLFSTALALGIVSLLEWFSNGAELVRWYPVFINAGFCGIFLGSLWSRESVIERIAGMYESLPPEGRVYCRRVTMVWSCFFIVNGSIALYTVLAEDLFLWGLYNGCISYILIALLFLVEYLVRRRRLSRSGLLVSMLIVLSSSYSFQAHAEKPDTLKSLVNIIRDSGKRVEPFVQQRSVRGLQKPFESKGYLTIIPGKQLVWDIQSPLASKIIVSPQGIQEEVQGVASDKNNTEMHEHISRILLIIHGGTYEELQDHFKGTFENTSRGYLVTLIPRKRAVQAMIKDIQLIGVCHPGEVHIHFRRGNELRILFPDIVDRCSL